jgi:hypothetical protein
MPRNAASAAGLALLFALSVIAASCSGPGTTSQLEPEAPRQIYRIQVHMTADQAEAEQVAEQVRAWWQALPAGERPAALSASGLSPDVVWQQPYYRVRVGRFTGRSEAAPALEVVRAQFGDAFIVPVPARRPVSHQ